ncbi:MAG: hypothetical protein ACI8RZ_002054 [Myxococcota bacterium]|jgi:hypothetical protein
MFWILALSACNTTTLTEGVLECAGPSTARVVLDGCLSSSCSTITDSTCTIEEVDGGLMISAEGSYTTTVEACTNDCQSITVVCELPSDVTDETLIVFDSNVAPLGELSDCE